MRVALAVTRSDEPGGVQVYLRDLAAGLAARGVEVTVLAGGSGWLHQELRVPSRRLRWMAREIHPLRDALALLELRAALRDLRPDLVSLHSSKAGWLGRVAAATLRLPAVYTAHGWGDGAWRGLERLAALLPAHTVTVCEADRLMAPGRRAHVIPNGVPDAPLRAEPATEPPRLLMAARFAPQKDHGTLLEALAQLRGRAWTLELPGAGPRLGHVRRMAADRGLADRVTFPGFLADPGYAQAQVAVLAARWEGLPLAALEAMRAGLPVVASAVGGLPEAVLDGVTGFLVPPGDPRALAAALARLLDDPALRARLGAAGRRRYEERFRHETMVERTLAVYREVARCG